MPCRTLKPPRFGACVRGCLRRPVIRELLTGYFIRGRFSALSWVVSVWSASKSSSSSSSFFLKEDEFPVSLERVFPTPRDFMFGSSCRSIQYFCRLLEWVRNDMCWFMDPVRDTFSESPETFRSSPLVKKSLLEARLAHANTTPVVWSSPRTRASVLSSCALVSRWLQHAACVSTWTRGVNFFISLFSLLPQVLSFKFTIVVNSKQTDNSG